MDNQNEKLPNYVGVAFDQTKKAELSGHEYFTLKAFLEPFQMAIATFNNIEQRLMLEKIVRPYTEDDLDENKQLKSEFWNKPKQEKEANVSETPFDKKEMD